MTFRPDDIPRLDPSRKLGDEQKMGHQPSTGSFESMMEQAEKNPSTPSNKTTTLSPFDLPRGQTVLASQPTFDTLLSQVKSAQTMLGDIHSQLQTKGLKLKKSKRDSLRNRLLDANDDIRAANTKMGIVSPAPSLLSEQDSSSAPGGIIGKFLGYVTEGQSNLIAAQQQLMQLKSQGDNLKPADFLAIQFKLAHAQQEIEFASIVLSKAVEDLKMLSNIQL